MHMNDGRVVSNFVLQALQNEPITVNMNEFNSMKNVFLFSRFMELVNKHVHFNMLVILLMVLLL
jgi:hypothetical protein